MLKKDSCFPWIQNVFSHCSELNLLLANFTRVLTQFSEHFMQRQYLLMCRTNEHGEKNKRKHA